MAWNNPMALARVIELVPANIGPGDLVVDVGCGTGELLAALVAARGCRGYGVDLSEEAIDGARSANGAVRWVCGDATQVDLPRGAALAICLGSTHAFGEGPEALPGACRALREVVAPGGAVLVGEGYHRRPLDPAYAELLGLPTGIERTHLENVQEMERHHLACELAITASEAEWDAFEWAFFRRSGKRPWRDAWLRWGRDTMGFGAYLARAPPRPDGA